MDPLSQRIRAESRQFVGNASYTEYVEAMTQAIQAKNRFLAEIFDGSISIPASSFLINRELGYALRHVTNKRNLLPITDEELINIYIYIGRPYRVNDVFLSFLIDSRPVLIKQGEEENIHEYLIGHYVVNNLKQSIPNFMSVYAYYRGPTMIHDGSSVQEYDGTSNNLVMEFIPAAKTMTVFAANGTMGDICLLLLQVYLALIIAKERFHFSHFDLHADNVLVTNQPLTSVEYRTSSLSLSLNTSLLATIIDYGSSKVIINGKIVQGYEYPNSLFDCYVNGDGLYVDFYRLFMTTVKQVTNPDAYQQLYVMFGGTDNIKKALQDQQEANYQYGSLFQANVTEIIGWLYSHCTKNENGNPYQPINNQLVTNWVAQDILQYYELSMFYPQRVDNPMIMLDDALRKINKFRQSSNSSDMRRAITWYKLYQKFCQDHRILPIDLSHEMRQLEAKVEEIRNN